MEKNDYDEKMARIRRLDDAIVTARDHLIEKPDYHRAQNLQHLMRNRQEIRATFPKPRTVYVRPEETQRG
jgi:hypothetical protein